MMQLDARNRLLSTNPPAIPPLFWQKPEFGICVNEQKCKYGLWWVGGCHRSTFEDPQLPERANKKFGGFWEGMFSVFRAIRLSAKEVEGIIARLFLEWSPGFASIRHLISFLSFYKNIQRWHFETFATPGLQDKRGEMRRVRSCRNSGAIMTEPNADRPRLQQNQRLYLPISFAKAKKKPGRPNSSREANQGWHIAIKSFLVISNSFSSFDVIWQLFLFRWSPPMHPDKIRCYVWQVK